jgi:hypothetical protein
MSNPTLEKRGAKNTNNLISFASFRRVDCTGFNLKDDFMKSVLKNLSLLSMGLVIYGCNEKISPELMSGNSTTIPTSVVPTEYYFKVENTSATLLNYKLHRTGPSNQNSKCEITSDSNTTGALSSSNYYNENIALPAKTSWDSKKFDISCFFEAEELSLYYSGFKFEVSASPNTCAYIGYAPFSFYDKIPGNSSTTYSYVSCDDETPAGVGTSATASLATQYDSPSAGNLDCGQYVDAGFTAGTGPIGRKMRIVEREEELCEFNYLDRKCDEGKIIINEFSVTHTPGQAGPPIVLPYTPPPVKSTRTIQCGGNHLNCVDGPIKSLSNVYAASSTELNQATYNEVFSKEYSYAGNYPAKSSNKRYANFRRNLANPNIDFIDSDQTLGVPYLDASTGYVSNFGGLAPETSFQPLLMDYYSYNYRWDGASSVVDTTSPSSMAGSLASQSIINGYTAEPYAAEPFLGFGSHRVNPFYTFYCFDEDLDIRGRIRMVVREWDRMLPTATTSMSYISDIGSLTGSRQDYAYGQTTENPGDPDAYNAYNDLKDWDDFLFMKRSSGAIVGTGSGTLWEPKSGFFNSLIFTNGGL